ncbi:MAG TPA: carboxypeptidase-like regulatory domain-containing protein [Longimicrobiales bacterium]|nr:carboxypeptidase-like regulatory domain-containing protein [Longimicrobiales bacterium]
MLAAALALAVLAAAPAGLAAQTDVIRGRVTGLDGQPLAGVRVTATSLPGNVTREAQTNARGTFQIAFPGGPGDYIMGYALFGYAFRQFEIKRLADEDVLVADARLAPVQIDSLVVVAPVRERVSRYARTPDVGGTERPVAADALPPELRGDVAAMAASLPGVLLVPGLDGEADGFSVLGLDADQNSVTLNGMPAGMSSLPRDATISSSLTTSPYDPSRGGFSGANFDIVSRGGSNFRSRGMSLVLTSPQVQWTDRAGQALGSDYTGVSLGGMASGPIRPNKAFYNVSYQLGRQSSESHTLLSTDALGLRTAGVAADSVSRLVGILGREGIPTAAGRARSSRVSDTGSIFGGIDFAPPGSSSGQAFGLTFNGNWRRQAPVGVGGVQPLALETAGGEHTGWGAGVQARHSGYFGMVLSETSAGLDLSHDSDDPYLDLPGGRVRVSSVFADGGSGVQSLTFGGGQGLGFASRATAATFQNTLSWFDNANKHRIKLATELRFSGNTQEQRSNRLGSFTFNSLEDLEAGRPAWFNRTLSTRRRATGQLGGSLSLGDSYRRTADLQFQYGMRLDASRYTATPAFNPLVESTFGLRNDRVPARLVFSPRIGFSWTVGQAREIASFAGAMRGPRAVIRGGIGVFASGAGAGQLGGALDNTGLPGGAQQLVCVGPAVPVPDWAAYARDAAAIPDRCADGTTGTVFADPAPNVTLFAPGFAPPKSVRSNLSWSGSVLDGRFSLHVDGTYSLNLHQPRFVDLNFRPAARFTLADDGRPVYVEPASIVPATGSVAFRDARVSPAFARVTELRSDLRSRSAQLGLYLSPIPRGPSRFGWSVGYTYSRVREQVSGFGSTAGNPLEVEWAASGQGAHQVSYSLRYDFFRAVEVSWNGWFRSGFAFTPSIAGDVNGDGYANDRAYIHIPLGDGDPAVAEGMYRLLQTAPGGTARCLERQLGTIARRNSCRGPWSSSASLNVTLDRARFRMPQRGALSFSLANPLGAADLLLHGSGNLRGWGQSFFPDPTLLYVRGFDPDARRFRYEVNPRFGATRPQLLTLRTPVMLTVSIRYDLGPTRERQMLAQQLGSAPGRPGSRVPEGMLRFFTSGAVPNPLPAILRAQDSLALTALQADSIAAMNRRYTYRADSLWAPVLRHLAALPARFDEGDAYDRYLVARRAQVDMLIGIVPVVRELLTTRQRRKLPAPVTNLLDPRYLALIRNGTPLYVGGGGGGVPFFTSPGPVFLGGESFTVLRP